MLRSLKPIEIAEGALLADIAVIYQLLATYVPFVGGLFRFPIFIVFAVLVLRRGLYAGFISGCVAVFLVGILMGPSRVALFLVEMLGGLYMGVSMRYRLNHGLLILIGATCGALALYLLLIVSTFVAALPLNIYAKSLQRSYDLWVQFLHVVVLRIDSLLHLGLETYWLHSLAPGLLSLGHLAIAYWWLTLYLFLWSSSFLATLLTYATTNLAVRMLGYDVRPFPGRLLSKRIQRIRRKLLKIARKRKLLERVPHAEV